MTKKEITEIFGVMILAWPNAEMFKGGLAKLAPTIALWTACLSDVDFWTGQQAAYRVCQVCRFPPSIAEFREQASHVNAELQESADRAVQEIKSGNFVYGSLESYYAGLSARNEIRVLIDRMGGVGALTRPLDDSHSAWNIEGITSAYIAMARETARFAISRPPEISQKSGQ